MEAEIYQRLSTDPTLTALIGNRLYPEPPEDATALPYVLYYRGSTDPGVLLNSINTLVQGTIQIEVISRYTDEAQTIATRIQTLLHSWRSPPTVAGVFWVDQEQQQQDDFQDLLLSFKVFIQN